MNSNSETHLSSSSIQPLAPFFTLTQVSLWDDGYSSENQQPMLPKHTRLTYDDDDDGDSVGKNGSKLSSINTVDDVIMGDLGVIDEMCALGLPLSFETNKQKGGKYNGRTKVIQCKIQNNRRMYDECAEEVSNVNERSTCSAEVQDQLSSYSVSFPEKSELSVCGSCIYGDTVGLFNNPAEMAADLTCDSLEIHVHDNVSRNKSGEGNGDALVDVDEPIEAEMTSVDDLLAEQQEEMDAITVDSSIMQSENPQSSSLTEESENMMVPDQDYSDKVEIYGIIGDWGAFWDPLYERLYFYNFQTEESTWYPPPGMETCVPVLPGTEAGLSMDQSEEVQSDKYEIIYDVTNACDSKEVAAVADLSSDLYLLHTPGGTKRKTRRKNRRRPKSSNEIQVDEESHIDITKYWRQRYLLFSKFDDGIEMDEEGWFSVTPESIAKHQASRFGGGTVIDCFTGVGGNAIQFAKTGKHVIAIDIDPKKIEYAHHNAAIYGVEDKIDFIVGDSLSLVSQLKADAVFLSPPWGGPDYVKVESYDINMLQPYDGQLLFKTFKEVASMIIMFLPRNVDVQQLAELCLSTNPPWSLEVEKNFLNGKFKAVTTYFSRNLT